MRIPAMTPLVWVIIMKLSYHTKNILFSAGLLFLSLVVVLNVWTVEYLVQIYGAFLGERIIRVWVADGVLLIAGTAFILIRFRGNQKIRLLSDVFIGLLLTIFLLFTVEIVFYSLNRQKEAVGPTLIDENPAVALLQDEWVGYKPIPNHQMIHKVRGDDEIIISATSTIDGFGRRVTPGADLDQRKKFILFFGCSYTFGWGVNDDETLPYFVQELAPDYHAYNYGVNGYGTQQVLAKLETNTVRSEVTENKGIFIYTFIDDHVNRVAGTMRFHLNRGGVTPYYGLEDDQLVRYGNFVSGRPVTAIFYYLVGNSQVAKYFNFNYPTINTTHYVLTARIIKESCNLFAAQFGSDDCYVLLYPGNGQTIKPYLEANHIKVLDYSRLFERVEDKSALSIPHDGHPTGWAYRLLAEQLTKDLLQ